MTAFAIRRTRGHLLVERNLLVYRHAWMTIFSGFFEPLFYLFSIGVGLGHFFGKIHGVSYASYVAPALLGNVLGGVTLVAALNHAQVVAGSEEDEL